MIRVCGIQQNPKKVSMKSGLEGRNNLGEGRFRPDGPDDVSMKSGLEGRNNVRIICQQHEGPRVSMKSGLEGRNNEMRLHGHHTWRQGLNEVRPRRPEQYYNQCHQEIRDTLVSMKSGLEGRNNHEGRAGGGRGYNVSMKSGLEGRNNRRRRWPRHGRDRGLNEVRPRRPEQSGARPRYRRAAGSLNEVRPRRPEQSVLLGVMSGCKRCLNEVRPRRPEQYGWPRLIAILTNESQ